MVKAGRMEANVSHQLLGHSHGESRELGDVMGGSILVDKLPTLSMAGKDLACLMDKFLRIKAYVVGD